MEIDSTRERALLGAGVKLRRLALDEHIDAWLMEYRSTRGFRTGALADRCEIGIQLEGPFFQRTHRSGGRRYTRGDIHVVAPGETYDAAYDEEGGRVVWFSVDADVLCENGERAREIDVLACANDRCDALRELAEILFERGEADQELTRDVRNAVRVYLGRRAELSAEMPVVTARRELERYFDSDLYLAQIAETAQLEPTTLLRQFARRYGATPIKYRIKRRLNFADRMLWARPDLSAIEIASRSGFPSLPHFFRQYGSYLGVTPALRRRVLAPALAH
jgi:AraC-like DNA-binding protein